MRPPITRAQRFLVAHAHGSPDLLLRVCLRSNLRRETGRWPSVFLLWKSRLRFAASGPHSPPRRRTRGRRSDLSLHPSDEVLSPGTPAALARKERFREHVWPVNCPWPWESAPQIQPDRPVPTLPPSRHMDRGVLAQPSNNTKKSGRGQCNLPHPSGFFRFIRLNVASRPRFRRQSLHDAW
jgi:hypothetical protein